MISSKVVKETLEKYVELVDACDIDSIMALYDQNAVVEDPVGSDPHVGVEAIESFYRAGLGNAESVSAELTGQVRTTSVGEGAMPFQVKVTLDGMNIIIHTLDVMKLNEEGKITSMKAYWTYEDNVEKLG